MKTITAYHCDFCKKVLQRKHAMNNHENFCPDNPRNRKICFDCVFCEPRQVSYYAKCYEEEGWGLIERQADGYFCTKKEKFIYTLNAERMLVRRYPETFKEQIPMVANCEMYVVKPIEFDDNF